MVVHKKVSIRISMCGRSGSDGQAKWAYISKDWNKVTCKMCLKKKDGPKTLLKRSR